MSESLRYLVECFDRDRNGRIGTDELQQALRDSVPTAPTPRSQPALIETSASEPMLGELPVELVEANDRAFDAGIEYATAHPLQTSRKMVSVPTPGAKLLTDGNDMCAAAAIFAGCEFWNMNEAEDLTPFFSPELDSLQMGWVVLDHSKPGDASWGSHHDVQYLIDNRRFVAQLLRKPKQLAG